MDSLNPDSTLRVAVCLHYQYGGEFGLHNFKRFKYKTCPLDKNSNDTFMHGNLSHLDNVQITWNCFYFFVNMRTVLLVLYNMYKLEVNWK